MEFRILGPLEVVDGSRLVHLPGGRGRALLALLILHGGQVVSVDQLLDDLWGETPPLTATTALRGFVSVLRRRLEPARSSGEIRAVLQTRPPGYILAIDPADVDANRFRHLLEEASGASAPGKAAMIREALKLWRGPALAEFRYEPFAQTHITALDELRLAAIEERIDADLVLGRQADVTGELQALVVEHPLRERVRGQLMLALYRSGRQADALEVYRDGRRTLVEELGIEPGPSLQRLEQAILRHDPALEIDGAIEPDAVVSTVVAEPWIPKGRRIVTVVILDVAVPARLDRRLDPEALEGIVGGFLDDAARVLTGHGATVERFIGDALVGVFGVPKAHEDDALRAVRSAVEVQGMVAALNDELERDRGTRLAIRTGINTGEAVVSDTARLHSTASGGTVNMAALLQRQAADGEIWVGPSTGRLVQDVAVLDPMESQAQNGDASATVAWRVVGLLPGASAVQHPDSTIVGRAAELARLRAAFDRAVARRTAYRLTVLGDAGIGKSRLATEFAEGLDSRARVLSGRCRGYGEGITFWPLREVVLQAAGPRPDALAELLRGEEDGQWIAEQVAGAIGLTEELGKPGELFPAVRRFVEALASRQPLVVTVEDLHWAEPTLLDLIDYLTNTARGPLFLLCLARPELLDERPAWGAGTRNADTMFLEPLGSTEVEKLLTARLAGRTLPSETLARIVETAQGNPLFAEQMLAAFENEGAVSIPASVHALLAARLDRLGPAERDLLRSAAVIGTDFTVEALTALVPDAGRPFVDRHLRAVEHKQLIRARSARAGKGFSFRHTLIQLAAYRSLTLEDRARLNERYADWLEYESPEPVAELDAVLGYHLEEAVRQRQALGLLDEQSAAIAVRAGEHLASAGLRAFGRFDVAAAENLLSRAKALLPSGHHQRQDVMRRLAEGYPVLGRHGEADVVLTEMLEAARADGDGRLERAIRLERDRIRLITGPDPVRLDVIREAAERALEDFRAWDDDTGAAQASYVLGLVHMRTGAVREMEQVARSGLAHADRSGHPREELSLRWWVAWAVRAGETPVGEAIPVCEELARWRGTEHPGVLCELAMLRAMVGQFDVARELLARARQRVVERLRVRRPLMFAAQSSAVVEMLAGDVGAAERELRDALERSFLMGEPDQTSQISGLLSRVLTIGGRSDEAQRFATLSAEAAPAESVAAQALWRVAEARVRASRDDHAEAERLAAEAVDLVTTEMPNLRADLLVDLAEVLTRAGQRAKAEPVIADAIELYERKGNLVSAAQARALAG